MLTDEYVHVPIVANRTAQPVEVPVRLTAGSGPRVDDDRLLDEQALADLLSLSISKVRQMRLTGEGPEFMRFGKSIRYARTDVRAWIANQQRHTIVEPSPVRGQRRVGRPRKERT